MATRGWTNVTLADIGMKAFPKPRTKAAGVPVATRSKYRAVKTVVNGWTFASKREAARYEELLALGAVGAIRNLELQPRFPLTVNGWKIGTYVADFRYEEQIEALFFRGASVTCGRDWRDVVEDVKGVATPTYRLKRKFVEALYKIQIREIR